MQRRRLDSFGLTGALCALAASACLGGGCRGPESGRRPARGGDRISAAEFRELLARGTIRPVEEMEGDRPFDAIPTDMGGDPRSVEEDLARALGGQGGGRPQTQEVSTVSQAVPLNPYLEFGERILVYPDGTITKPFPLPVGTGAKIEDLIRRYGNFPLWEGAADAGPSTPDTVKVELLPAWDTELQQDLRNVSAPAQPSQIADWLLITTGADLLYEVEDFINLFSAGVPQIEIEAKIVEVTFNESLDLGIKPVSGTPIFDAPGSGTFVKELNYSLPNAADGGALLTLGSVTDGLAFNAILQALSSRDNVAIISRPKIAVREGGRADISSTTRIPYLQPNKGTSGGNFDFQVNFIEVGVKLYVVPRVVGTETVALNIDIEASQQSGREVLLVTAAGEEISAPVLSQRSARTTVYLEPGQAVILGGLITERNTEQTSKVPILGDLPLINPLFRSKFTRKEQGNVLFFIRPRVLTGAEVSQEF